MVDYDIDVLERVWTRTLYTSVKVPHCVLSVCDCLFCPTCVHDDAPIIQRLAPAARHFLCA